MKAVTPPQIAMDSMSPSPIKKQRRPPASPNREATDQIRMFESEINRLKEAARTKDEFIRITNHELRTPLDVIRGNLDMILKGETGPVSDRTREYLDDVLAGADRLTRLVNDMLDISRIETGQITFILGDVDMGALIKKIENEYTPIARKKNLTLTLKPPSPSLFSVFSDSARIIQIVSNLINNAFKFTPAGGSVTISIEEDNDMVKVTVQDTGIGISPENQKKLFKQFPQIDLGTYEPGVKGTGLGLFLIRRLAEQLGGDIRMESSAPGKGSSFVFRLPRSKTARAQALSTIHAPPLRQNNRPTV